MKKALTIILLLLVTHVSVAQMIGDKLLWASLARAEHAVGSPAGRAIVFTVAATVCRDAGRHQAEDSLYFLAVHETRISGDHALQQAVYRWYSVEGSCHDEVKTEEAITAMRALANRYVRPEWHKDAFTAEALLRVSQDRYAESLTAAAEAHSYASSLKDARATIQTLHLLGYCNESAGRVVPAFQKYYDALVEAERIGDVALLVDVCESIAHFYLLNEDYAKAMEYQEKLLRLMDAQHYDSARQMNAKSELASLQYRNGLRSEATDIYCRVIAYAQRRGDDILREKTFRWWRTDLVSDDRLDSLAYLYRIRYPGEFKRTRQENPALYCRLMAYFLEMDGHIDSAARWFAAAERLLPPSSYSDAVATFYFRYGQFLVRSRRFNAAIPKLTVAYTYAVGERYTVLASQAASLLDSVYRLGGNFPEAYRYAKLHQAAAHELADAARKDKLLRIKLASEEQSRLIQAEAAATARQRAHNLQYMLIVLCIIAAFIGVLWLGSLRVPRTVLRTISFLSFILLFEFIILLADIPMHHITHGEPWKLMTIKLVFIAGLSQLHHWMEHRLAHYLSMHRPFPEWRRQITFWWKRDKQHQTSTTPHTHPPVEPSESADEIF